MSGDLASLPADLQAAAAALAAVGVDRWGVADHGDGSAVVFASAGPALWRAVVAGPRRRDPVDALVRDVVDALARDPADARTRDPVNALTRGPVNAWVSDPADAPARGPAGARVRDGVAATQPGRRWVRIAADDPTPIDARDLALRAGLGWPSRLGLVLHPEVGPWLGLRAACLTDERLPATGPLPGAGPCPSCPAPCAAACPPQALPVDGWDAGRCLPFQAADVACHAGCLARRACPVGAAFAHDAAQGRYHQHPPSRDAVLEDAWR